MRLPALHWQILIGVFLAAAIGIALNLTVGTRASTTPLPGQRQLVARDTVDRIDLKIVDAAGSVLPGKSWIVDPSGVTRGDNVFLTLDLLKRKAPEAYRLFQAHARSTARRVGDIGFAVGNLFLRMLKMVSVPLIITSLLTGVLGLADARKLRKLFGLTMTYYVVTSALAICTGIFFVNLFRPGVRSDQVQERAQELDVAEDLGETLYNQLQNLIPQNPFEAVAQGDFLSIIAFSLAFGIFALLVGGRTLEVLREFFQAGFDVMMRMTMAIIALAPIGVFALMLYAASTQSGDVFGRLAWYLATVAVALGFHALVTLPLVLWFFGKRNPLEYAQAMSPALLTAFSSASSNATLPLTMNCVEKRAGISNRVGSFVLPLGATINMDGTALFEAVAVLFIAQLEPTISLTLTQQFMVAFTALLASIGAAGIPSAGLVMMIIVLQAVGLPTDRVALILAVDRILDMCRTSVNVWSDACGCAVVAYQEGADAADPEMPHAGPAG